MSVALAGRATAAIGIVSGLLAVGLTYASGQRFADDGTTFAFLVVLLSLASHFPAEIGRDLSAAAMGAAAFGFYLFVPAGLAFEQLGDLEAGGWLGLCTVLVPLGVLIVQRAEGHSPLAPSGPRRPAAHLVATVGLILIVVAVWLPVFDGGDSYWESSHTLGILLLLLAVLVGGLLATGAGDLTLLLAATLTGLATAEVAHDAFEGFGEVGSGGWLAAAGGAVTLLGVLKSRWGALAPAPAPAAS